MVFVPCSDNMLLMQNPRLDFGRAAFQHLNQFIFSPAKTNKEFCKRKHSRLAEFVLYEDQMKTTHLCRNRSCRAFLYEILWLEDRPNTKINHWHKTVHSKQIKCTLLLQESNNSILSSTATLFSLSRDRPIRLTVQRHPGPICLLIPRNIWNYPTGFKPYFKCPIRHTKAPSRSLALRNRNKRNHPNDFTWNDPFDLIPG